MAELDFSKLPNRAARSCYEVVDLGDLAAAGRRSAMSIIAIMRWA